jgi:hypothetical protein
MKYTILICLITLSALFELNAQENVQVRAETGGAGWKRVAKCTSSAGRGFGTITIFTVGGAYTPYANTISWFKSWGDYGAGLYQRTPSVSGYWNKFRITYEDGIAYLEVYFTKEITRLELLLDSHRWGNIQLFEGVLPDGGGAVLAEAAVGRMNVGEGAFFVGRSRKVGIRTENPKYELSVNGTIGANEIRVESNGADFVFAEDYNLLTLEELKAFINQNKHLPEIAPANKMQEEGMAVGELNTKLLQKVEELTLYIMELHEEGIKQREINEELLERIEQLEEQIK